jgi:hypothetical protein
LELKRLQGLTAKRLDLDLVGVFSPRMGLAREDDGWGPRVDVEASVAKVARRGVAVRGDERTVTAARRHDARGRDRAPRVARLGALDSPRWCGPEGGGAVERGSPENAGGEALRRTAGINTGRTDQEAKKEVRVSRR